MGQSSGLVLVAVVEIAVDSSEPEYLVDNYRCVNFTGTLFLPG